MRSTRQPHFIRHREGAGKGVSCSPLGWPGGWWAHPGAGKGFVPPSALGLVQQGFAHPSPCSGDGSGTGQESCTLGTERPGRDKERDATNLAPVGVSMCPGRQEQGRRQAGSGWQGSSAAPCLPFPRSRAWRLTGSLQPLSGLTGSSLSPSPFA